MKALNEYNISDIENMTREDAEKYASEKLKIKEHDIFLVDFGGYFGYSCLVFWGEHYIHYANDYQLHHPGKSQEQCREWYIEALKNVLYTEEELETVSDYTDYSAKLRFLIDHYSMREDGISAFFIGSDEDREKIKKQTGKMYFSDVSYRYYNNPDFVKKLSDLEKILTSAKKESEKSFDYMKKTFLHEMLNHEYGINWQGDYDVISCFANVNSVRDYENIDSLFEAAKFTDMQKKAYMEARTEYYNWERENQ